MKVFPLTSSDWYAATTMHGATPPPLGPGILPHIEGARLNYSVTFRKIAERVLIDGAPAVQLGHDVGFGVPHMPIPLVPPNPVLPATIAFSSCKAMFGKSNVIVAGTPAAWWLPGVAMLHVCSDPFPLPVGLSPTAPFSTVRFGFSWSDLLRGYADITIDQAISFALSSARDIGRRRYDSDMMIKSIPGHYRQFIERITLRLSGKIGDTVWKLAGIKAEHAISGFLDKGIRTFVKKAIGKAVPTSTRKIEKLFDGDDAPPPPEAAAAPEFMFDDGMLDDAPLLGEEASDT